MNEVVQPDEILREAEALSHQVEVPRNAESAMERLRADCLTFFDAIPEPPLYPRPDDPGRSAAAQLIPRGRELLARCLMLTRRTAANQVARALGDAVQAHVEALCHTAQGRISEAESAWRRAIGLERAMSSSRRLWIRSDEADPPVFDRGSGQSRFDPRPEPMIRVKLACPEACQFIGEFAFSPRHATHSLVCSRCKAPFVAYLAEALGVETKLQRTRKRYLFKVQELGGGQSRIEFDDYSGAEFEVAKRDLLAFLYSPKRELRGVLDLSSGRLLRLRRTGPCFLATAVFGEEAPELSAFRAFRDEFLLRRAFGIRLVRIYYRLGPALSRRVAAMPRVRQALTALLGWFHRMLVRSGYG